MLNVKFILGELGLGKVFVIRKFLNGKLFNDRILRIIILIVVKLWNLYRVRIIIESDIGNIKEKDFIEKFDFERKDGVKVLRYYLKNMLYMIVFWKIVKI